MLTPSHLQRAQQSIYEKVKLHNRCLHGWGVVCGLEVSAVPAEEECPPGRVQHPPENQSPQTPQAAQTVAQPGVGQATPAKRHVDPCNLPKTEIWVDCGVAIDCWGHDLVVRQRLRVDLYSALSPEDRKVVDDDQAHTLWVSLCFKSYGVERARAVMPEGCGTGNDAFFAFHREGICIQVALEEPIQADPCETCCTCCDTDCVLLARIDGFCRGYEVGIVDNSVRRLLTTYVATVISAVGWHHGATYGPEDVDDLLWNRGLRVKFSRSGVSL
jgi:hypothetical protein